MKIALLAGWISRFSNRTLLCLLLAVLVVLSAASSLNKGPWSDEGHFASAAYNLAVHGFMGTTVLPEPNSPAFQGIGKHTYWIMPLSLVHQAAWFKLFGFSLFIMRSVSIFYGVAAVAACFYLLLSLTRNRWAALLGAGLIATDYAFVMGASLGRPDMMCAAFGFGGIACYLHWREQQLTKAIVLSQTLIVLSGMSHFNGS
jgi:4-amino-4-deoxy-L-arabinose transferase-like glycosyltransferase